ncbi:Gp138 family membrane-puncturing spike protein [Burkholderia anthina]|uniref:Gp138 family membrane-puncturing spike protein n=1 Tax=Burkholderia anthina TaxID=179879 RepID=UPI001588BE67|nr:Gp138 family membrane-puncturing spike protein [Burkholderia anthina]
MGTFDEEMPSGELARANEVRGELLKVRTAFPGIVESFDEDSRTATVRPAIDALLASGDGAELPLLVDVPVSFPTGGGFVIEWPLKRGDEGQVTISDRCIDGWFVSGRNGPPLDLRMHDLSDAMFTPGIRSRPNVPGGFDMGALVLRQIDGPARFRMSSDGIIELDGALFRVTCPAIFEQLLTYKTGMTGEGGGAGTKISGNIDHSDGTIRSNGVSVDKHRHPVLGNETGDPQG